MSEVEGTPEGPQIGADEWVARAEERTGRRGRPVARSCAARAAALVGPARGRDRRLALLPFVSSSDYLIRVGVNTLIFALLALGLNVVVGWAGLLDLGYVAFYGFGAYVYALLSSRSSTCTSRPCSRSRS